MTLSSIVEELFLSLSFDIMQAEQRRKKNMIVIQNITQLTRTTTAFATLLLFYPFEK
jgi:hypothetical protein